MENNEFKWELPESRISVDRTKPARLISKIPMSDRYLDENYNLWSIAFNHTKGIVSKTNTFICSLFKPSK